MKMTGGNKTEKNINVTLRVDEELKKQADSLFNDLGMNLSTTSTVKVRICYYHFSSCQFIASYDIASDPSAEYLLCDLLQFSPFLRIVMAPISVVYTFYNLMLKKAVPITEEIYLPDACDLQPCFRITFRI